MAEAIFAYVVIGYFVWLASIVLLTANGLIRWMADGPRIVSDSKPSPHRPLWTQGAAPYFLGAVFGLAVLLLACGLSALNTPAKSEGRPISDLLSEARSPDPSIRRDAVESLGLRIWRGQRPDVLALRELLAALKDPDESVRSCADMSLESTRLRHLQREEIPVVQAELKNPDKRVRHKAAEVLFEAPAVLYSKDVEHLITTLKISALKDDDPYVRQTAARWMSYGCVPEDLEPAKAALTAVLEDRDEQVRRWAASSLEELKRVRY
jgi:HEAT repeat protein